MWCVGRTQVLEHASRDEGLLVLHPVPRATHALPRLPNPQSAPIRHTASISPSHVQASMSIPFSNVSFLSTISEACAPVVARAAPPPPRCPRGCLGPPARSVSAPSSTTAPPPRRTQSVPSDIQAQVWRTAQSRTATRRLDWGGGSLCCLVISKN